MTLVKWTPRRGLTRFPDELNRFFDGFSSDWDNTDTTWSPSVDIAETETEYEVKAELAGLRKEEIKISVEDNVLKLSGEKKAEKEDKDKNYHYVERSFGHFERSFRLPKDVRAEEIKAKYKNGILSVEIPKSELVKPKEIPVS